MPRFATVLGVVATLVTMLCGAVVVSAAGGQDAGTSVAGAPAWQTVAGPLGSFEVPPESDGWTLRRPGQVVYYADDHGDPLVGVAGPAVLDDGYCAGASGASNRGFAGLSGPRPGSLRRVHRREARRWRDAVAGGATTGGRTGAITLDDGSVAIHTHVVVRPAAGGPCQAERVALDHVSVVGSAGVVTLVVVRDLGADASPAAVVDRVLRSLRVP